MYTDVEKLYRQSHTSETMDWESYIHMIIDLIRCLQHIWNINFIVILIDIRVFPEWIRPC